LADRRPADDEAATFVAQRFPRDQRARTTRAAGVRRRGDTGFGLPVHGLEARVGGVEQPVDEDTVEHEYGENNHGDRGGDAGERRRHPTTEESGDPPGGLAQQPDQTDQTGEQNGRHQQDTHVHRTGRRVRAHHPVDVVLPRRSEHAEDHDQRGPDRQQRPPRDARRSG
jgi:hypothetical protein